MIRENKYSNTYCEGKFDLEQYPYNEYMSKSRLSGDLIEKTLCDVFGKMGLECSSPVRLSRLQAKIGGISNENLLSPITEKVSRILPAGANKFSISSDRDGVHGVVSDVIVHGDGLDIGISCKRNNFSIKHQRPLGLHKHLALSDESASEYKRKYKEITTAFYDECCKQGWGLFRDVPSERKSTLYKDVNELVKDTITAASGEQQTALMNYLISKEDNGYILYVGQSEDDVRLYKYEWGSMRGIKSVDWKDEQQPSMIVLHTDGVKLCLRLHNASSRVTKIVSLKYDTTILSLDDIRKEYP